MQTEPSTQPENEDTTSTEVSADEGLETQEAVSGVAEGAGRSESEPDELLLERDQLREQLLRVSADFENAKKRAEREREEARKRAAEDTLREMLPVIDNLERAVEATKTAKDIKAVVEGVSMVLAHFRDSVSSSLQLERIDAVGKPFDPNVHEAVQQIESEQAPGTIVTELLAGYTFRGRLLRPSMVAVAKASSKPA